MSRLELTDNAMSSMVKMAEGNPGAAMAITEIMANAEKIDPQAFAGGIGVLLSLDGYGIYGTDIYVLYSDKCDRNVRRMLMLLRATQLGLFSHLKLKEMAADQMRQVNLTEDEFVELDQKVCEQLTEFERDVLWCDDCEQLSPTEAEQDAGNKGVHYCKEYKVVVKHNGMHPRLPRPKYCDCYKAA